MAWLGMGALATVAMAATLAVMVAGNDAPAPEDPTTARAALPHDGAAATPPTIATPPAAGNDELAVPPAEVGPAEVGPAETTPTEEPDATTPTPASDTAPTQTERRRTKPKSSGPPSDSVLIRRLEKKIAKECSVSLGGGSVTVKFLVTSSGGLMGLTATGPAASCANKQVQGTEFRTRSKSTALMVTAK